MRGNQPSTERLRHTFRSHNPVLQSFRCEGCARTDPTGGQPVVHAHLNGRHAVGRAGMLEGDRVRPGPSEFLVSSSRGPFGLEGPGGLVRPRTRNHSAPHRTHLARGGDRPLHTELAAHVELRRASRAHGGAAFDRITIEMAPMISEMITTAIITSMSVNPAAARRRSVHMIPSRPSPRDCFNMSGPPVLRRVRHMSSAV